MIDPKHILTRAALATPNLKYGFWSPHEQVNIHGYAFIYNGKLFLPDTINSPLAIGFLWFLNEAKNSEDFDTILDFINRANIDLWAESEIKDAQTLLADIKLFFLNFTPGNSMNDIYNNLKWMWIDVWSIFRFCEGLRTFIYNFHDKLQCANFKEISDCTNLNDLYERCLYEFTSGKIKFS